MVDTQFLKGRQFPQLTFAHQPHGKQDAEIDQDGTEDQRVSNRNTSQRITAAPADKLPERGRQNGTAFQPSGGKPCGARR